MAHSGSSQTDADVCNWKGMDISEMEYFLLFYNTKAHRENNSNSLESFLSVLYEENITNQLNDELKILSYL